LALLLYCILKESSSHDYIFYKPITVIISWEEEVKKSLVFLRLKLGNLKTLVKCLFECGFSFLSLQITGFVM